MPAHVFVDESKTRGLLVAAAGCEATSVNTYRRAMAQLLLPRQRRIHFTKESTPRQRKILDVLAEFDLTVRLYRADRDNAVGRRACLEAVVADIANTAERLVVERDESTVDFDRQTLFAAARKHGCTDTLQYELLAPRLDPMLWIPDAIAWAWAKGGDWRHSVASYCCLKDV